MKQDPGIPTNVRTSCGNCGLEERLLLHHVRHRGIYRRLCTSCVLRLHPQSFCPICFLVYDRSPPSDDAVTCFKCYSFTHSHCIGPNIPNPFICRPCADPKVPIFNVKKKWAEGVGGGVESGYKAIDKTAARALLAAARIAAISMSKAAAVSRAEAEKRAKEAAFARKRAREALEHVAFLAARDKLGRVELPSAEVSGSGNVKNLRERGGNASNVGAVTAAVVAVPMQIQTDNQCGAGVDGASEVLASLNAVELSEHSTLQGFGTQNVAGNPPSNGVPTMDMEDSKTDTLIASPILNAAALNAQNHVDGNENEVSEHLENHNELGETDEKGEKVKSVLSLVLPVGDELHQMQNSHDWQENLGLQQ